MSLVKLERAGPLVSLSAGAAVTRLDAGVPTQLRRLTTDRPGLKLEFAAVRFVEGPPGGPGPTGPMGPAGLNGDGNLDGVAVDIIGVPAHGQAVVYDANLGKFVNSDVIVINGGAF